MKAFWLANRHLIIAGAIAAVFFAFAFSLSASASILMLAGECIVVASLKLFKA